MALPCHRVRFFPESFSCLCLRSISGDIVRSQLLQHMLAVVAHTNC